MIAEENKNHCCGETWDIDDLSLKNLSMISSFFMSLWSLARPGIEIGCKTCK